MNASDAAPTREQMLTRKVASKFGSLYVHVTHTRGRVTHVSFSAPGKFDDTTINDMLQRLGDAATAIVREISQLPEEFI